MTEMFPIMNVARNVIYKICTFLDVGDLSLMREVRFVSVFCKNVFFLQVNKDLKSCIDHLIEHGTTTVHGVNISHVGVSVFNSC